MPGPLYEYSAAINLGAGSDADMAQPCRGVWVGGAGNVKVTMQRDGTQVTFTAVPAGTLLPVAASRVWATGTTATLMVALY